MNDVATSIIRTIVPILVGALITLALKVGIELDPGATTIMVQSIITGVYYAVVRLLERSRPKVGILLGKAKTPQY